MLAACGDVDARRTERAEVVARTCVSFVERKLGTNHDAELLAQRLDIGEILAAFDHPSGNQRATVTVIRGVCRPRPPASGAPDEPSDLFGGDE